MSEPASATSVLGASVRRDQPPAAPSLAPAPAPATAKATTAAPPQQPHGPPPRIANDRPVFVGLLLIVLIGAVKILLRNKLARRHWVSLDLAMVAIGFVLLLMMRLPIGRHPGWIGTALFLGLAGVYRLLGYFEEPDDRD